MSSAWVDPQFSVNVREDLACELMQELVNQGKAEELGLVVASTVSHCRQKVRPAYMDWLGAEAPECDQSGPLIVIKATKAPASYAPTRGCLFRPVLRWALARAS